MKNLKSISATYLAHKDMGKSDIAEQLQTDHHIRTSYLLHPRVQQGFFQSLTSKDW